MGRPRTPTVLHALRGTEQVHPERMRERENEPQPLGGVGPCSLPDLEAAWDYLVGCAAPGVLTSMDKVVLAQAAALLTLFWKSPLEFDAKYHARLHALLGAMGMTPADRSKVVVARAPKSDNPFARFRGTQ